MVAEWAFTMSVAALIFSLIGLLVAWFIDGLLRSVEERLEKLERSHARLLDTKRLHDLPPDPAAFEEWLLAYQKISKDGEGDYEGR